jgi:hypothetical protein
MHRFGKILPIYHLTYQERWGIEDYHKSLKNNASLEKSLARTPQTQKIHFLASLCAYIKLERLKINEKLNHFALWFLGN